MARNGSGTYSKVNTFIAGNTITAAGSNQNWDDLVAEMTNSVAADGQTPITGALKGANGTAAAPAFGFNSDPDTGTYRHGANELGFATGGTVAGYFDSAQKFWTAGVVDMSLSTSHAVLPTGTTAQRPGSPAAGMLRYNSQTGVPEYYGTAWVGLSPPVVPQGRLTLTSGTPVLTTSATAQSTIYYTPYNGNLIPVYDGTSFVNTIFTELSLVMSGANFVSGAIYDLFAASDSGTLRLAIGPAWSTATVGAGARGTGAGTTELERKNGIWTNKNSMTARYASGSTFAVAANQGTYLGTVYLTGTAQTSFTFGTLAASGGAGTFGLWNAYNRVRIASLSADNTNTWAYSTGAWRGANNSSTIRHTFVAGLSEDALVATYNAIADVNTQASPAAAGVGYDVTNAFTGTTALCFNSAGSTLTYSIPAVARLTPTIGLHFVNAIEWGNGTCVFYGDAGGSVAQTGLALDWQN
jgi:hypothetical protein